MKILYVIPRPVWDLNGLSKFVYKLSLSLKQKNINAEILSFSEKISKPYFKIYDGLINFIFPKKRIIKSPFEIYSYYKIIPFLLKYGKKYDIIHTHSFIFTYSLYSLLISKFLHLKNILTIHGGILDKKIIKTNKFKFNLFLRYVYTFLMIKILGILSNSVIFISKSNLLKFRKIFLNKKNKKIYLIPNGLEIEDCNSFNNHIFKRKYITFIGNLNFIKGIDVFLKIIREMHKRNKSFPFLIIGKPIDRDYLNQINKFKKYNITYYYNYYPIKEVFLKSKIYINTSRIEGISTTILEAMNYCTPVIASNIPNNSEIIKDGFNGYLFNLNNIDGVIKKIEKLYCNKFLSNKFVKNARKILRKYDWDVIISKHIKLYQKELNY
ncbi:MAG: glycosyltransferase family 4 protein [Promethearchaeota archaeon]